MTEDSIEGWVTGDNKEGRVTEDNIEGWVGDEIASKIKPHFIVVLSCCGWIIRIIATRVLLTAVPATFPPQPQ